MCCCLLRLCVVHALFVCRLRWSNPDQFGQSLFQGTALTEYDFYGGTKFLQVFLEAFSVVYLCNFNKPELWVIPDNIYLMLNNACFGFVQTHIYIYICVYMFASLFVCLSVFVYIWRCTHSVTHTDSFTHTWFYSHILILLRGERCLMQTHVHTYVHMQVREGKTKVEARRHCMKLQLSILHPYLKLECDYLHGGWTVAYAETSPIWWSPEI